MLNKFLTTAALGAFVAVPAMADMHSPTAETTADPMDSEISVAPGYGDDSAMDVTTAASRFHASDIIGADLLDAAGDTIASVDEILITSTGDVEAFLVDVGGFLGIGAQTVAISLTDVSIEHDENDNLVLRSSLTQEQLEAMPEYEEFS